MKTAENKTRYTIEEVQDNFWLLPRMYYDDMYAIAFALTNDQDRTTKAVDQGFHSLSWLRIQDYKTLEDIRQKLKELVEQNAKSAKNAA